MTSKHKTYNIIGRVPGAVLDLARGVVELHAAGGAREVVPVVHLAAVAQRLAVYYATVGKIYI